MARTTTHHGGEKALRIIRNVYLYLVAMIGLIVFIIGSVGLTNNVIKNYIFGANEYRYISPFDTQCEQFYTKDPTSSLMLERTPEEIAECERRIEEQNELNRRNDLAREFSINIAQIVIGLPVWLFHWGIIQREYRKKKSAKK